MSEWFKDLVLKTSVRLRVPWVRIPPCPPSIYSKKPSAFKTELYPANNLGYIKILISPLLFISNATACKEDIIVDYLETGIFSKTIFLISQTYELQNLYLTGCLLSFLLSISALWTHGFYGIYHLYVRVIKI